MKKYLGLTLLLLLSLFLSKSSFAQKSKSNPNYSNQPYWIEMIKDPKVNYFEAVKAYDSFWANREKPMEEDQIIGQDKSKKETFWKRWFNTKEEKRKKEYQKYALEVKKFEHWKMKVMPYVQEDGSILDADQQLKIWQDQQKNK